MPYNLLLLPLLGSFVFIRKFVYTKFASSKLSGQPLLLWTALLAVFFTFIARLVVIFFDLYFPLVGELWKAYFFSQEYSGTASLAFVLGSVLWMPLNLVFDKDKALSWSIKKFGSRVEKLFCDAMNNEKQVLVTLRDGKVYVGLILWMPPEAHSDSSYIGLLPIVSGYRDQLTKRVIFTTDYVDVYQKLWSDDQNLQEKLGIYDFNKYFKIADIETASIYDADIHTQFKKKKGKRKNSSAKKQ